MKRKIKEYFVFDIYSRAQDTEDYLNKMAREGWRVVCSYATCDKWIILERDKEIEVCDCCKGVKGESR